MWMVCVSVCVQITSGEYIQMSGRAGRRGIDDRGIVMLMVDEQMDSTVGKNLLRVMNSHTRVLVYRLHTHSDTLICYYTLSLADYWFVNLSLINLLVYLYLNVRKEVHVFVYL